MQILWTGRLNLVTDSGQCEHVIILGGMMPLTNSHQSSSDGFPEPCLSFCAALEDIGRHNYALKLKWLFSRKSRH